jgi:hypothetical protein
MAASNFKVEYDLLELNRDTINHCTIVTRKVVSLMNGSYSEQVLAIFHSSAVGLEKMRALASMYLDFVQKNEAEIEKIFKK